MNKEPQYEKMPEHYLLCFNDECALAENCLHRLAARNPVCNGGESCRYYKPNKVSTMAYGMKGQIVCR